MEISLIFGILVMHYITDFILQTDWEATNKSHNNKALFSHVFTYSYAMTMGFGGYLLYLHFTDPSFVMKKGALILFWTITFSCHFLTDYITSRESSKLYKQNKIRPFWYVVGFDQVLHYIQLFLTVKFLL